MGSKLLLPATTRDQVAEAVQGMTQAEKDAVAQGVRSHLDDAMANVQRTLQDGDTGAREAVKALKNLSSRANREKLETVIGKGKADALLRELDQAATSFDLRAR
jgi:predicted secreted Zn-dependent protease